MLLAINPRGDRCNRIYHGPTCRPSESVTWSVYHDEMVQSSKVVRFLTMNHEMGILSIAGQRSMAPTPTQFLCSCHHLNQTGNVTSTVSNHRVNGDATSLSPQAQNDTDFTASALITAGGSD